MAKEEEKLADQVIGVICLKLNVIRQVTDREWREKT